MIAAGKTYFGAIIGNDVDRVVTVRRPGDGREYKLPLRLDLANHSPTGFCWGYGGSGPAQLALAICADIFGDMTATKMYWFLQPLISSLPMNEPFELTEQTVRQTIERIMLSSS